MFKPISPKPDFVKLEKKLLKRWYKAGIVKKYLRKNEKSQKRFRFLDGPITANNPMGVHHAWGRTLKDLFQRYKNMRGFKQRFQNGFDCQGLWLEVEVERDLGFNSKRDIENFGLARFSRKCRQRVEKFSEIQTEQSKRLGMFMDWGNSYYTMSETNNEYIWHFLKKCHQKGWLYKGINSMPWCTRCGTALSAHELSDGGYQLVDHEAVFLRLPLKDKEKASLLIWTTTPWTLLANVAVAVHPELTYVKVKIKDEFLILAKSRLELILEKYQVVDEFKGKKLLGLRYQGPFDELKLPSKHKRAHKVIKWTEVSEGEGTGLVHIAPGAGAEDFGLAQEFNLPVIAPLDEFGDYLQGFGKFSGKNAKKVNEPIFKSLKEKGLLYKKGKITHSYPICWRCKEEVVFRVTEEWFINVKEIRPRLKKAAKTVRWIPESVGKRMQDWLTNMADWPISRRRYWGLALPFWECPSGHLIVVGSRRELKKLAVDPKKVDKLPELHRPWIDKIKVKCPECNQEASRTLFVGDCWLDAGIVAFSTLKYLEDRQYWEKWFPAELVAEYVPQVKLWFYALLFMAVALEDRAPYEAVHTHQFVVDEKGEAMHKSKGNAIWFDIAAEKMGVDVMRWMYLRADNTRDLRFGFKLGDETRRQFLLTLWNVYNFLVTYANVDKWQPRTELKEKPTRLDLWILTRLNETVIEATEGLDNYDPQSAALVIEGFVQDLSVWYLRRSRDRVGPTAENKKDKDLAYSTLYTVMVVLSQILAPFTPYLAEEIYKNLTKKTSVHLTDWPEVGNRKVLDQKLVDQMKIVRQICELGHAARKKAGIKVRQPLAGISCQVSSPKPEKELLQLIKEELNVKEVSWQKKKVKEPKVVLDTKITSQLKAEGETRELVRQIQALRKETGCRLDQRIVVYLPKIPKDERLRELVKKKTLAKKLLPGKELKIVQE